MSNANKNEQKTIRVNICIQVVFTALFKAEIQSDLIWLTSELK